MTADERFDRIDANIERLSERIEASVVRLGRLEDNLARLTQYVLDFRGETASRLEIIENRLDVVAANINNIEARFPTITKAILDFGKPTTQAHSPRRLTEPPYPDPPLLFTA
jgi:hypothetical protein